MKAGTHPALYQCFRLVVVVEDIVLEHVGHLGVS